MIAVVQADTQEFTDACDGLGDADALLDQRQRADFKFTQPIEAGCKQRAVDVADMSLERTDVAVLIEQPRLLLSFWAIAQQLHVSSFAKRARPRPRGDYRRAASPIMAGEAARLEKRSGSV
jgi:hypothetical protein